MSGLTLTFTTGLSEKSLYSKILKLLHCCIDVIYRKHKFITKNFHQLTPLTYGAFYVKLKQMTLKSTAECDSTI